MLHYKIFHDAKSIQVKHNNADNKFIVLHGGNIPGYTVSSVKLNGYTTDETYDCTFEHYKGICFKSLNVDVLHKKELTHPPEQKKSTSSFSVWTLEDDFELLLK